MSWNFLGETQRIVYESKNFESGVSSISAIVMKPNGVGIGPFNLIEITAQPGVYYFDLTSNTTDPSGNWVGTIIDGTHKSSFKATFLHPNDFGGGGSGGGIEGEDCDPLLVEIGPHDPFQIELAPEDPLEVELVQMDALEVEIGANPIEVELIDQPVLQVEIGVCA